MSLRRKSEMTRDVRRQSGSALVIALVFLLLMTLIGVTAMQTTTLQERMAGNERDRNLAFQAAEAALREAEEWVANNAATLSSATELANPANWDGSGATDTVTVDGLQLAAQPVFHVGPPQFQRLGSELPPVFRCIYPITTRGVGGSDAAVVVLRSNFSPGGTCE